MSRTCFATSLAAALMLCGSATAQRGVSSRPGTMTFDEALTGVASYQVGDSRDALVALSEHVTLATSSPENSRAAEKALIKVLEGKATLEGKDQVCRLLLLIGTANSVPVLSRMLGVAETADMARYALERMPGAEMSQALRTMLPKTSGAVRVGIVNTLGRRKDTASVATLRGLLTGADSAAASAAAAALGQIAGDAALAALTAARLKTSGEVRSEIGEASVRCGEQLLAKGDTKKAFALFRQLSTAREPEQVRIGALRGLALSGGPEALPLLVAAIKGGEPRVQAQAIRQASAIPDAAATGRLVEALPALSPLGRIRVIAALAGRGDKSALPALIRAVRDTDQGVRVAAFQALGQIGNSSLVLLLAETAAKAAAAGSPPSPEDAPRRSGGLQAPGAVVTEAAAARESLYRLRGVEVDQAILAEIGKAPPPVKVELIRAAGARVMTTATPVFLRVATDPDRELRRAALLALSNTASPADAPALVGLLTQAETTERPEAARALASVLRRSDTVSLQPVISACQSTEEPALRGTLLSVLGQVGREDGLPPLRLALKDGDPEIRRSAILALTQWPTVTPGADLLDAAQSDASANLQILALRGYVRLVGLEDNRPPAETLRMLSLAMGAAKRSEEKKAVLALLARLNSRGALLLVEQAAGDPEIAGEAKLAADQIREKLAAVRKQQ